MWWLAVTDRKRNELSENPSLRLTFYVLFCFYPRVFCQEDSDGCDDPGRTHVFCLEPFARSVFSRVVAKITTANFGECWAYNLAPKCYLRRRAFRRSTLAALYFAKHLLEDFDYLANHGVIDCIAQ